MERKKKKKEKKGTFVPHVMNFIKNDPSHLPHDLRSTVQHIPQNLVPEKSKIFMRPEMIPQKQKGKEKRKRKKIISKCTSVVMTRQLALGLMVTSPVMRPTSENSSNSSRYFWLLKALMGDV